MNKYAYLLLLSVTTILFGMDEPLDKHVAKKEFAPITLEHAIKSGNTGAIAAFFKEKTFNAQKYASSNPSPLTPLQSLFLAKLDAIKTRHIAAILLENGADRKELDEFLLITIKDEQLELSFWLLDQGAKHPLAHDLIEKKRDEARDSGNLGSDEALTNLLTYFKKHNRTKEEDEKRNAWFALSLLEKYETLLHESVSIGQSKSVLYLLTAPTSRKYLSARCYVSTKINVRTPLQSLFKSKLPIDQMSATADILLQYGAKKQDLNNCLLFVIDHPHVGYFEWLLQKGARHPNARSLIEKKRNESDTHGHYTVYEYELYSRYLTIYQEIVEGRRLY